MRSGIACSIAVLLIAGACGGRAPFRACTDTVEARALACSGQTARRVGDTLFVRLDSGRDTMFIDNVAGRDGGYHYAGRIGRAAFHLIESYGNEMYPTWVLMNGRTGHEVVAADTPVVSPDTVRFATGGTGWDNCSESNGTSLDVWRLTDTLPLLEWRLVTQKCNGRPRPTIGADAAGGWGATNLHWRAADTLEFVHNDVVVRDTMLNSPNAIDYRKRPMLAVHDRGGWRILDAP